MTDILHRVIADSGNVFGLACDTTLLVNEACRRHDTGPTAAAALGRALTGAVLLSALLKDGQSVQLKFEGCGPIKKIITEAGYDGWARGYVGNPQADVPLKNGMVNVAAAIGRAGFLTVTKDIGLKQKYQGTIQLYTGEIGEDIAYYLLESEQTPSIVALSVQLNKDGSVGAAGGYLVQALPPVDETILTKLEARVQDIPSISDHLHTGKGASEMLATLFADIPHHATGTTGLDYTCSCNREKMEGAIISLGTESLRDLIAKEGGAEVQCEFCRDYYSFSKSELTTIINRLEKH
ncbi:Hsp33 family molecular chaperone HslO [Desulfopila sp. IMCC35008]|uniref:Hsp33 family molecular chaperone HslO n=1 Tax=Desulfopila sp. IMCC35008 TaxID=2653858 RepID=UPI0013D3DB3F|nr:Hsp33 family molecular chaperone HslO [Desulfopila sp. IMCC35008]